MPHETPEQEAYDLLAEIGVPDAQATQLARTAASTGVATHNIAILLIVAVAHEIRISRDLIISAIEDA